MFFIYTLFKPRQTVHHIFTLNGSNGVDSLKGVPFLALFDIAAHLLDKIAQKLQFWGRE